MSHHSPSPNDSIPFEGIETPLGARGGVGGKTTGVLVLALAAVLLALALPGRASASATGCTQYGPGRLATFCGSVKGSGTYVQAVGASFLAAGLLGWNCNARVRFDFINNSGQTYLTYYSSLESGCNAVGAWAIALNRYVSPGTLRFTLLSNGATISVVQERIG